MMKMGTTSEPCDPCHGTFTLQVCYFQYRNFPFIPPPSRSLTDKWSRELLLLGRSCRPNFGPQVCSLNLVLETNIKYHLIITPLKKTPCPLDFLRIVGRSLGYTLFSACVVAECGVRSIFRCV